MASFFYFFPRVVNAADYEPLGLGYAFERPPVVTQLTAQSGPGGNSGTVLHDCQAPALPLLRWYQAGPELWIGYNPHSPPGPLELRKPVEIAAGTEIRLADGKLWSVPRVLTCTDRDPQRAAGLPKVWTGQGDDGELLQSVPEEYQPVLEQAGEFLGAYLGAGTGTLGEIEILGFVAELLGVGYRVTSAELLALGLIDAERAEAICMDAIDGLERELARAAAAITQRLDQLGVVSWAQLIGLRRQCEAGTEARRHGGTEGGEGAEHSAIRNPDSALVEPGGD